MSWLDAAAGTTAHEDTTEPDASSRTTRNPLWVLAVVGFSVFVAADDLTVVTTMLRPIISDLGLVLPDGLDEAAWVVNSYLIAFIAVMPIAGRLSDVIGRRRTLLAAYAIFTVGTIVIPLSTTLGPFLAGRVLTAIGGGAMVPVALAVVGDVYHENGRAKALGTLGAIETLGWVWGPLYGAILVRFLDWRWQFWLNIPMALVGMALVWFVLADHDQRADSSQGFGTSRPAHVDWWGAAGVTAVLVGLNVALLGNAKIQSVSGLDELSGQTGFDTRWFLALAFTGAMLVGWRQRRAATPIIDTQVLAGRPVRVALLVNLVLGAAIVITMVDVPLLVNSLRSSVADAAVASGWSLAAFTAAMSVTTYLGGRLATRWPYRKVVILGFTVAAAALLVMGRYWRVDTSLSIMALHLGVLGSGLGLVVAPSTAAVVDNAPDRARGSAASIVMVARMAGLSLGLSGLTAWGLARFDALRRDIELPSIADPDFGRAASAAQRQLTSDAIGDTFLAAGAVVGLGLLAVLVAWPRQPKPSPIGVPMNTKLTRVVVALTGILVFALIGAFVMILSLQKRLDETQSDLARVEAGSALFASQVTGFQRTLVELEPVVDQGFADAVDGLETFANSSISFDVEVDETIAIDTEVTISRTVTVPINEVISIRETIAIREEVETTIVVNALGFDVPVDVKVPVDIDVPISIDVPIDLELEIPIDETVPVHTEVPVRLSIPIDINVADTDLATLAEALAEGLTSFQDGLGSLTPGGGASESANSTEG